MNDLIARDRVIGMSLHRRRPLGWLLLAAFLLGVLATSLARGADIAQGERLYAICAACHGVDGAGHAVGEIPVIAGQHSSVLIRQIDAYRRGVRWDVRMEHAAQIRRLGDAASVTDVAAYVASLPLPLENQRGDGRNLVNGERLYAQRCRSCHGAQGEGNLRDNVPRLAAQHYSYLQRQFLDVLEKRRPQLSASHVVFMRGLERDTIDGIADHLSRLRPAKNPQ